MQQSTTIAPPSTAAPAPDRPLPATTLQKVANWVVIVVGVLVGLHLIAADVLAFQLLSSIGDAFGGGVPGELAPGMPLLPADDPYCLEFPSDPMCTG
jgi:hypothetical protein